MKRINLIFILVAFFGNAYSTEQIPDKLIADDQSGMLIVEWSKSSPFEQYIDSMFCSTPFTGRGTANYRGFVATWRLLDSLLYLEKISIEQHELPLTSIFGGDKNAIFANWYSGIVMVQFSDEKKRKGNYSIWKISFLKFKQGRLLQQEDAVFNVKNNIFVMSEGYADLSIQYDNEIKSALAIALSVEENKKDCFRKRSNQIEEIKAINKEIESKITIKKDKEMSKQRSQVKLLENTDRSFNEFVKLFSSDREPILGLVNGFPYSIHYSLSVNNPIIIGSIWLWMPVRDSLLVTSYFDMIEYFKNAELRVSNMNWLKEWKNESVDREVEVQIFGKSIGETDLEMELTALPAWRLAGLNGGAMYKFYLREKRKAVATLYMSNDEEKTLVTSLNKEVKIGSRNLLDSNKIFYHKSQIIPEFATIGKRGEFELNNKPANRR
ncbi:MAG: hypothetical protein JXR53_01610 [Bacteroidales bacterium]|nr:hypothetical protein [Bacteroidales bacterium]